MEYSDEHLKSLISDASYLVDEAEALTYVIGSVPVSEKTAGIDSILEMIAIIDHAQQTYYRPLAERLFSVPNVNTQATDFRTTFALDETEANDPVRVLKRIAKHRVGFMNFISKLPLRDLRTEGKVNGKSCTIASLLEEMVNFERKQLKLVAERILSIDSTLNKSRKGQ